MSDPYQLLGVGKDADRETIKREYVKRREALQKSARLPEAEKADMLAALDGAYKTLKAQMPQSIPRYEADANRKPGMGPMLKKLLITGVVVALAGGGAYAWWQAEEQKRIQRENDELERIATEKRAARLAEEEKKRKEAAAAEIENRRLEEEERIKLAQEQREAEMKGEKYVAGQAFVPRIKTNAELREEREARSREFEQKFKAALENRIEQIQSDREAARARAEVQRQQRFVDQSQREEEIAAQQRARAALRDQMRSNNPR